MDAESLFIAGSRQVVCAGEQLFQAVLGEVGPSSRTTTYESKVPKYEAARVSMLGIETVVLGKSLVCTGPSG